MNQAVWMYTGQGALKAGAARALYEANAAFRTALDQYAGVLAGSIDRPLLDLLLQDDAEQTALLGHTRYAQPALVALQLAQAVAWEKRGVHPATVLGHSIGEFAAAVAAGVMHADDALRLAAIRGRLMDGCEPGAMAAVFAPVARLLPSLPASLVVAAENGPDMTVLAGPHEAMRHYLESDLQEGHTLLPVSHAFHSPMMAPAANAFLEHVRAVRLSAPGDVVFVSTLSGQAETGRLQDPDYWCTQILQPVRFMAAAQAGFGADPAACTATELGPGTTLIGLAKRIVGTQTPQWVSSVEVLAQPARRTGAPRLFRKVQLAWNKPSAKPTVAAAPAPSVPVEATPDNCVYEVEWIPAGAPPVGTAGATARTAPDTSARLLLARTDYRDPLPDGWYSARVDDDGALPTLLAQQAWSSVLLLGSGAQADVELGLALLQKIANDSQPTIGTLVFATLAGADGDAGLWGLARTARLERPDRDVRCIEYADGVLAEVLALAARPVADPELALDHEGVLRTARLRRAAPASAGGPWTLNADATYIVSGGRGALGLVVAQLLVARGVRRLLLLSRTPHPADAVPAEIAALRTLAQVECLACDVGQLDSVRQAHDWLQQAGWPAVAGIVHAAGVLSDGVLANQSADKLRLAYAAKVDGAHHLRAIFAPSDFLTLFSSASSTFGSAGQGNYAAANATLDALARSWSGAGENVLAIQWGAWSEAGMARRQDIARRTIAGGMGSISNALGAAVLEQLLAGGQRGVVCVSPIDWANLTLDIPLVARLRPARTVTAPGSSRAPVEVLDLVRTVVAEAVGKAVSDDVVLMENGLDSLGSVSLRNQLAGQLGVELSSAFVFEFPTINTMVRHLAALSPPGAIGEDTGAAAAPPAWELPVLVIGAGIGGLSFAHQLEKAGVPVIVMDAAERSGGVWQALANTSSKLQIDSAPYDFDSTGIPTPDDHHWGTTFPQQSEILSGCAAMADRLAAAVHLATRVLAVRKLGDQEYEVSYEQGGRKQLMRVSGVAAMTGGLHQPRRHQFPQEECFRGHVALGIANDTPAQRFAGASVVIVGHGAFAVENMRTALENGARHVTILCRQRQLVMSTFCNWLLNSSKGVMPVADVVDVMRPFYDACGLRIEELPSLARDAAGDFTMDQATVPAGSDLYFLAQMIGKLSVVVDEAAGFEAHAVLTAGGRCIPADILLKCLGSDTDETLLPAIFGESADVQGLWINGDRNLFTYNDGGQAPRKVKSLMCASYAFFVQSFAPAYLKFRQRPGDFARALARINTESPATTNAERVLIELWDFVEPTKRVLAERIAERCPFDRFQSEREAEWARYARLLGGTEAQSRALWQLQRPTLALMHRRNPHTPTELRNHHASLGPLSVFVPARRRVLFLPGQGTNARLARALLEKTGWIGRSNLDFVVPDAPYEMPAFTNEEQLQKIGLDGLVSVGLYDKSAHYREWRAGFEELHAQHHHGTTVTATEAGREQWRVTLAYLREIVHEHGPFDGIAGFCEGAAVASVALHLQMRGEDQGLDSVRFFIAMSPWRSPLHQQEGMFRPDRPLELPMLQIVGDNDMEVFLAAAPQFRSDYANASEFRHGGQHVYPPLTPGLEAKLKQLLNASNDVQFGLAV